MMGGDKFRVLIAIFAGFAVGCAIVKSAVGQPLRVMRPSLDMALQPMSTQSKFMQPMQATRPRASTALSAEMQKVVTPYGKQLPDQRLVPCKDSKAFAKRQKNALKELEKREKKYDKGSVPALALESTAARTVARYDMYAKAGLLCGTEGLPHLIAEPGLAIKYGRAGEVLLPTIGFLLVAGWIGETGRLYLSETNGVQQEILIDVPRALACMGKACAWPGTTLSRLRDGTLSDAKVKP